MYCLSKTFFICGETVIRGSDKRSPLYVYLFVQVWDCVQRRYSHFISILLVQVLRDAPKTVKRLVRDREKVHSVLSYLCIVT